MSKLQHRNSEGLKKLQNSVVKTVCDTEHFILEGSKFYIHYAFLENFQHITCNILIPSL